MQPQRRAARRSANDRPAAAMSFGEFLLGAGRLAAIAIPAWLAAHRLRIALSGTLTGALAGLGETIAMLSITLLCCELLGLVGLFSAAPLIALLWALALIGRLPGGRSRLAGRTAASRSPADLPRPSARPSSRQSQSYARGTASAAVAGVVVVATQWVLQSANSLGSGMLNFDTLWYHMPLAAEFARSGSVTAIQFTVADPYVAYFPANSELFHALGIITLHGDFLSPLLNLLWLSIALLAAWCVGRRWQVQPLTLLAGCLVVSLPVLSGTQPGEAFNDIPGLACLLAASALALNAAEDRGALALAGLALGLAAGTKLTFLVPAAGLVVALTAIAAPERRRRVLSALVVPAALTGGWWYLRNLIAVGNPLGLGLQLGPLRLPGPGSVLAEAQSQTVISELSHLSLWGSRFLPGLDRALGPLWPVVAVLYLAGMLGALFGLRDRLVRMLALVAGLAGVSYLVLPTGASGIEQDTTLFEVNLRYATPALALAIPLIPILVRERAPKLLPALGAALLLVLLGGQLEHSLWPTQTARHVALIGALGVIALAAALAAKALAGRRMNWRARRLLAAAVTLPIALGAVAFVAQRHYFARRYEIGFSRNEPLGTIFRWAQGISHTRMALYGSAEQYPLYGARDTNALDYLGERTGDGGYRPISSCRAWRRQLSAGRYAYVVLTPAPTRSIPQAWTAQAPGATLVMTPAPGFYVYKLSAQPTAAGCS
jgi:hypothetical protein